MLVDTIAERIIFVFRINCFASSLTPAETTPHVNTPSAAFRVRLAKTHNSAYARQKLGYTVELVGSFSRGGMIYSTKVHSSHHKKIGAVQRETLS